MSRFKQVGQVEDPLAIIKGIEEEVTAISGDRRPAGEIEYITHNPKSRIYARCVAAQYCLPIAEWGGASYLLQKICPQRTYVDRIQGTWGFRLLPFFPGRVNGVRLLEPAVTWTR